jgi:hypothetical protein
LRFTINNPTEEEKEKIKNLDEAAETKNVIAGMETTSTTGTEQIQGT